MLKNKTMRLKILFLCLGCTLAGLLLQTYLFQTTSSELIYNQAKSDSYRSMENMQDDIYTFIKSIENGLIDIYNEKELILDLRSGMESSTLQNRYYRTAYDIATENFQTSDGVVSLYIYDKSHRIISTYRRAVTPKHNYPTDIYDPLFDDNAEKVKEYVDSDETQMLISSYYNIYREKNIVRFVLKVYNSVNIHSKIGYVVCDVDSKILKKIMRKYTSEDEIFIWLQPFNDRPVLAAGNIMDSDSNVYEQISNQIQKGDQEFENIQEKNKVFFSVYQDKYNLGAYTLIPRDLLNKNQKILNENLILITLIMLAVVSISFYFVSRLLSRPLEEMTKTVKRIQGGETQLRMENLRNDEVGELGKSFNNMLDQIEKLIADEYENKMSLNYARYQALQAQINPHFLYNTLDTMGSIAEIQGCIQVSNLCQSLAGLFRYSLDMKNPLSTVSGELVHLKNYIYVMNVRMQNQVEYEFHIDDNVLQDTLPRISIQPLVENALNHGLKNQKGKKKVIISAGIREDDLLISVEDNGIGMSDEKIRELFSEDPGEKQKNRSIGIFNIHKRMQYLYGESYGVKIKSEPEKGTVVFLEIPRKIQGENQNACKKL